MKQTRIFWLVLLVAGILVVGGGWLVLEARAQGRYTGPRWEYAWVYLPEEGQPVFSRAEREVTIGPSSERLSGGVDSIQQGMRSYKLQTRSIRDDAAAALDIAGQEGWEAVGVVEYEDGLKVLLKRRA